MACAVDYTKKSIFVITGASKGIGREISTMLAKNVNKNSVFILLARSTEGLEETKTQIGKIDNGLKVLTYVTDLSKPNFKFYNDLFDGVLKTIDSTGTEYGYIFHNAASNGPLKEIAGLSDLQIWRDFYEFNLFSTVLLNNAFLHKISPVTQKTVVINISSGCGIVPYENFSLYGSSKAARQLFFKILAIEQPNLTVLSYCPGAVKTEMFNSACDNAESKKVREVFQEMRKTKMITTEQTVGKLLEVLKKGDFKSGDVIDYHNLYTSLNNIKTLMDT
ncbi:sepiapterin reductase-like [Sitophilus oryzae]|uniref:Sepiapterin reductase-like n=1 Tax=Sitophilus oryzae TaxID=7048 RepID=A0A6J2YXV8_SITOR|nr:sepiapterin reductase-like [Sitophilus oryzae]